MTNASGAFEIVACGFRPEASLAHFVVLIAFVLAARWLAPSPRASSVRR